MAPPGMVNIVAQPTKIANGTDTAGLVSTGQLSTLLPNANDVTNVLESMKRISDAKTGTVPGLRRCHDQCVREHDAQRRHGIQACAYTKSAYLLNRYPSPGAVDPDDDPAIVSASGSGSIFNLAEYQSNGDFQKTAAVMKLVINGDAAAGTIQIGGFDYHTGDRATGETRDFNAGQCIGAVLQYAALGQAGHDLRLQRRLARERRHDR